jgi:hypothetical protein
MMITKKGTVIITPDESIEFRGFKFDMEQGGEVGIEALEYAKKIIYAAKPVEIDGFML